jgi:hypothetical protein
LIFLSSKFIVYIDEEWNKDINKGLCRLCDDLNRIRLWRGKNREYDVFEEVLVFKRLLN